MTTCRLAWIVGAIGVLIASPAQAQKTFYVAGYGGAFEQAIRRELVPSFEKKAGMKVEYAAGTSVATLARLTAEKAEPKLDVAILDDGPMNQAVQLGLCGQLQGLSGADFYDVAQFRENRAIGIGLLGAGLMYSTKYFKDKNWAAPTSWTDLGDPKYRKLVVIPPVGNTYGLYTLVMMARMNGGGEKNIEPGIAAMKAKVHPNVLAYEASPNKIAEMFQAGRAALAVWGTGRVQALADAGLPVEFVYPKEGALALVAAACPVAKPVISVFAHEFVRALVAPEFQLVLARDFGYGPVNKRTSVPSGELRFGPLGERAAKLTEVDWDVVNQHREEWAKRWIGEIER